MVARRVTCFLFLLPPILPPSNMQNIQQGKGQHRQFSLKQRGNAGESLFFLFLSPFKKKWQHWNLESGFSGRSWNWKFCLFSDFPACSHDQSLTPSLDATASVRKKTHLISLADGLEVVESCGWRPHHWMSLPAKAPPLSAAVTCVCSHLQRCEHKQRVNAEDQRCSLFCLPLTLTHRDELAVFLLPPHYKAGRTIIVEKSFWTLNYCH